jgi:hypothetical protein
MRVSEAKGEQKPWITVALAARARVQFTCAATGDPPLNYQWLFDNLIRHDGQPASFARKAAISGLSSSTLGVCHCLPISGFAFCRLVMPSVSHSHKTPLHSLVFAESLASLGDEHLRREEGVIRAPWCV